MNKQKDGYFYTTITYDGKKKQIKAKNLTEIQKKKMQFVENEKNGIHSTNVLMKDWASKWLEIIEVKIKTKTLESYSADVRKIIKHLGEYPVRKILQADIQDMINNYSTTPRTAQALKRTTSRIFEYAIDNGIIAKNPCRNIVLPRYKAKEKRALSDLEIKALSKADFTDEERLLVNILYYTGIRKGELLALSRKSIDLNARTITIDSNLTFASNSGTLTTPKTAAGIRTIPIPDALYKLLSNYKYDLYLFTRNDRLFTKTIFLRVWKNIIKKMNNAVAPNSPITPIFDLTPHIFRHNYASMLFDAGIEAKEAQLLLGHSSIVVTLDIYTHLGNKFKDSSIEKINKFKAIS